MKQIVIAGGKTAPILIVTDAAPTNVGMTGAVMRDGEMNTLVSHLRRAGIQTRDCRLINPCTVVPQDMKSSEKKQAEHLATFAGEFWAKFAPAAKAAELVVVLGKLAARQTFRRAVKITKLRGVVTTIDVDGQEVKVLPTLSPNHVLQRPEVARDFESDIAKVARLMGNEWKDDKRSDGTYELVYDPKVLDHLIHKPAKVLAVDTETTGLKWARDATIICVQLSYKKGHSYVIPLNCDKFKELTVSNKRALVRKLSTILGNPKTKVIGHNFKYDMHMLQRYGIRVANWWMDTMQLMHAADENMQSKSLSEGVRRWVPSMSGYSDRFDDETDKGNMMGAKIDELVEYAGGDTDATLRLCEALVEEVYKDKKQWQVVMRVKMPALRLFYQMEEQGISINSERLRDFAEMLAKRERTLYDEMIKKVKPPVLQKHYEKGLSFGRSEFVCDILFSEDGYGLTPVMFTPATRNEEDPAKRVPAVDYKHLMRFKSNPFVKLYQEYQHVQKMKSTYVGNPRGLAAKQIRMLKNGDLPAAAKRLTNRTPEELQRVSTIARLRCLVDNVEIKMLRQVTEFENDSAIGRDRDGNLFHITVVAETGFWKHIMPDGKIHPSFVLHTAVTGRTSSRDPNAQNIPKRSELAKPYRKCIVASPGFTLIEGDLSQAELRVAAWMAQEQNMIRIYRSGGDIHRATAARVMGIREKDVTSDDRFKAKAVNFGFLYGMGARSFVEYARTDYGVRFTESESEEIRDNYFRMYPGLLKWHEKMRKEAHRHGCVRALHGALRRLPSINSPERGFVAEAERQAVNSPVQGFASDLGLMGLTQFGNRCPWDDMRPVGFIHDSVIVEARTELFHKAAAYLKWCMQHQQLRGLFGLTPPLPIVSDVEVGDDLGSMSELKIDEKRPPWIK